MGGGDITLAILRGFGFFSHSLKLTLTHTDILHSVQWDLIFLPDGIEYLDCMYVGSMDDDASEGDLDTCQTTGSWSLITRLLPRVRACM